MKKLGLIVLLFLTLSGATAQDQENRAFKKGNSMVSVGYGVVNYWKILVENGVTDNNYEASVKATGPFILAYEYGLLKRVSIGMSLGYSVVESTIPFGTYKQVTTLTNFSAIALANYHFFKSKNFDPYIGGGIGYYNFQTKNADDLGVVNFDFPDQFAVSCQAGCRYYFTKWLGAHAEVGYVGGAFSQFGLVAKF